MHTLLNTCIIGTCHIGIMTHLGTGRLRLDCFPKYSLILERLSAGDLCSFIGHCTFFAQGVGLKVERQQFDWWMLWTSQVLLL